MPYVLHEGVEATRAPQQIFAEQKLAIANGVEHPEPYRHIREGFHLAVQGNDEDRPGWEVTHSPRFCLVDPKGRIRGYYESSNPKDLERLREDVKRLYERDRTHS